MHTKMTLSHADAMRIIAAIRERAEAENAGLAAAVVDEYGELIAFLRTDGCRLPPIQIALNKAYTAAREQIASKELGTRALSAEDGFPMTNFGELRYVTWGGGIPIRHRQRHLPAQRNDVLPGVQVVRVQLHRRPEVR